MHRGIFRERESFFETVVDQIVENASSRVAILCTLSTAPRCFWVELDTCNR